MVGRERNKSASWIRSIKVGGISVTLCRAVRIIVSQLTSVVITIAVTIIVIVDGKINNLLQTGDDLPDGGEVIVVGIRHFCLFRGIGRATGRERLAGCREALKST